MNFLPNLLIVDDSELNLILLKAITLKIEVNIIEALSGKEALEKIEGIEIALAIIDVQMPGMNGYELSMKMNDGRTGNKIPVIFLTAHYSSELQIFEGYNSGAVDYIFKPVDSHILLCKINVFLDIFNQNQIIIRNIAELKKSAEQLTKLNEALKKSEQKLKGEKMFSNALLNSIPGIFYLYTYPELQMVTWNKQHETLFGYHAIEMKNRYFLDWYLPEARESVQCTLQSFIESGQITIERPLLTKDGRLIPFLLTAVKFESHGQKYLIGTGTDITERKQTLDALRKSETMLTKAQQIAQLGSWELNIVTRELFWSEETYRIFGYDPDSVTPTMDLFLKSLHPDDQPAVEMAMAGVRDSQTWFNIDHRIITPDKEERTVHQQAEIIYGKSGVPETMMGIVQDITERKNTEDELKDSLEQLKQLSYYIEQVRENERVTISRELHDDLGQALTAVKIDLGMIRQKVSDQEVIQKINKVTTLVGETIKTVQRLTSQLRPDIIDHLGLEAAIEWYTREFEQRYSIEILLDIDSEISLTPDASLMIFRIIQESLTNIARHSKASRVEIIIYKKDDTIHFMISDNGIGITQEQIKSKKSFGIISMKERTASMGGAFDIYNKKSGGSVVELIIPLIFSSKTMSINNIQNENSHL